MHSNRKSHLNGMKPFDCSDLMIRREKSGHWFILIRFDSICFAMNEIRMLVKSNFVIPIKRCLFRYKYWNWERHQPSCMFEWPTDKFIRTRKCSAIKMSHTYDYLLIKKKQTKKNQSNICLLFKSTVCIWSKCQIRWKAFKSIKTHIHGQMVRMHTLNQKQTHTHTHTVYWK